MEQALEQYRLAQSPISRPQEIVGRATRSPLRWRMISSSIVPGLEPAWIAVAGIVSCRLLRSVPARSVLVFNLASRPNCPISSRLGPELKSWSTRLHFVSLCSIGVMRIVFRSFSSSSLVGVMPIAEPSESEVYRPMAPHARMPTPSMAFVRGLERRYVLE